MQENCLFGSEGGAKLSFVPTPIGRKVDFQFSPKNKRCEFEKEGIFELARFHADVSLFTLGHYKPALARDSQ